VGWGAGSPYPLHSCPEWLWRLDAHLPTCVWVWGRGCCFDHLIANIYFMHFFFLAFCLLPILPPQERLLWLIDLMEVPSWLLEEGVGLWGFLSQGQR
jgi:hypothetical protein